MWVELFGNSRENDVTPTDEQEPKQPNSSNRPRCRLDSLPSGTKALQRARQEADEQVLPDFTSGMTAVVHSTVAAAAVVECSRASARVGGSTRPGLFITSMWTVLKGD